MNVNILIRKLRSERERIMGVIGELERLQAQTEKSGAGGHKRGRKSIGPQERLLISHRMKSYWASRREGKTMGE
ncbi:MAG: hypothetical protein C5B51_24215 [Terriglobia bacterium]|nr:MAG: hypothetical protein C5B51_24215 [Terriglobia bacterium]